MKKQCGTTILFPFLFLFLFKKIQFNENLEKKLMSIMFKLKKKQREIKNTANSEA